MRIGWFWTAVVIAALAGCQRHKPEPYKTPPLPVPTAATGPIGNAACDAYLKRVASCTKLTAAARDAFARGGSAWQQAVAHPGAAAQAAEHACKDASDAAAPQLAELGC